MTNDIEHEKNNDIVECSENIDYIKVLVIISYCEDKVYLYLLIACYYICSIISIFTFSNVPNIYFSYILKKTK